MALCATVGFSQQPITRAGDKTILSPADLKMDNNTVVKDAAAPTGEAIESAGKKWYIVHKAVHGLPAGKYRVTVRLSISKRDAPNHVGRIIVNSTTGDSLEDLSLPFETETFRAANEYQDLSLDLMHAPKDKGKFSLLVRVLHENPAIPVRVAQVVVTANELPPVVVYKVCPEKLLARPNSSQPITVSIANTTDQPQSGLKLQLRLTRGVGENVSVGEQGVSLQPFESREVTFPWNTGKTEYGYEVRATLVDAAGKAISALSDYFAVSSSHFRLRINATPQWNMYLLDKNHSVRAAQSLRLAYGNYVEVYGWAPSAFGELYPRHRFWTSGQISEWKYDRDAMKAWIGEMHRLGMFVTAYNISLFNGWPGQEIMRQHPEWCSFNEKGRPNGGVNTAYWQTKENVYGDNEMPKATPFVGEMPNHGSVWPENDDLMKHAASEILLINKELGFDGMRWDGHPIVYVVKDERGGIIGTGFGSMIWNHEGKRIVDLIPKGDLDAQSLHNMQLIKETVRKAAPDFQWGYNAGYDKTVEQQPNTWQEVVKDAGIWVEGGFRSGDEGRADPSNTWDKYIDKLYLSSQFVIRSGGYPIHGALAADSAIMRRFMNALFLSQGSHACWHGGTWGEFLDHSRFATRYSQYLFDPALRPWWGYPDIHVSGWVQWEDRNAGKIPPLDSQFRIKSDHPLFFPEKTFFTREVSNTERESVLHLFNHPGKPYIDYTEMNPPPIQKNVEISIKSPPGMKATEAWCLSPDQWPMEEKLSVAADDPGWVKLTIPTLEVWNTVVVKWEKG